MVMAAVSGSLAAVLGSGDGSACSSGPHVVVKRSFAGEECSAHHMKRALSLRQEKHLYLLSFFLPRDLLGNSDSSAFSIFIFLKGQCDEALVL